MTERSKSKPLSQSGEIHLKSLILRQTKILWEIEKFAQVFSFDFLEEDFEDGFIIKEKIMRESRSKKILSPLFTSSCGNVWQIEITGIEVYNLRGPRTRMEITVYIREKKTEGRCQFYLSFSPSIEYSSLDFTSKSGIQKSTSIEKPESDSEWCRKRYIEFSNESRVVKSNPTGNVTLILTVEEEGKHVHRQLGLIPDEASISNQLVSDIGALLDTGEYSDITLTAGDATFKAHKNILSARSPVFETMLSSDMQEATLNVIEIDDLDANTVQMMLKYMYTGKINCQNPEVFESLLYAAEKYQLEQLKQLCSIPIAKSIKADNVIDLLVKSHLLHMDSLKKHCIDFVLASDVSKLMQSEDWVKVEEHPELYKDMIQELYGGTPAKKQKLDI